MYLKYVIFLITAPILSQPFFTNTIDTILIQTSSPDDIHSIDFKNLKLYVYNQIPNLKNLSVEKRKNKFINLILPAILIEKHKIKHAYNYVLHNSDSLYLNNVTRNLYEYCKCNTVEELLFCLTEQPTSIILAQAAIETGWGTSRFFLEGFNLFGIHTYDSNQNMQAYNSSRVYVKKYSSMSESISHYLRTLARVDAYSEFRKQRANSKDVKHIINYLTNYSERREFYVDDIKSIIEYNQLYRYDSLRINN